MDRARWLARFPALSVMVLLRRDVGYRLLSPVALVVMFLILSFFGLNANNSPFRPQDLLAFAVAMLAAGIWQRLARWRGLVRGDQHHTYYVGTSRLESLRWRGWVRRNRRIPRFIDPAVCLLAGFILKDFSPMLAAWLFLSGLCLRLFEFTVHQKELQRRFDTADGLIDSEIQGGYVEHFEASPEPRNQTSVPGLATGLGEDIKNRTHRRSETRR